jgi:hypothetical protein
VTRQEKPSPTEDRGLELIRDGCAAWDDDRDYLFETTIPRRVAIANAAGEDIAYLVKDDKNNPVANLFDPLFKEICNRIWHRDCA